MSHCKNDFFKGLTRNVGVLLVVSSLTSCGSSKKIIDEYVEPEKRFLAYVLSSKKNDSVLNFYIVNNTTKEYIEYYFYKNDCRYIEKRMANPIIKGQRRTFTISAFVFGNETSIDSNLSNSDQYVLAKAKTLYDSLKWCNNLRLDEITGLKIIPVVK